MPPPRQWPPEFEREHGCTEAEWLGWLPGAVGSHTLHPLHPGRAEVSVDGGQLSLAWMVLPPRAIALIRMPRLQVRYRFDDVDDQARERFMRYFDLYMQRGGG
jgi:hypothetical protein